MTYNPTPNQPSDEFPKKEMMRIAIEEKQLAHWHSVSTMSDAEVFTLGAEVAWSQAQEKHRAEIEELKSELKNLYVGGKSIVEMTSLIARDNERQEKELESSRQRIKELENTISEAQCPCSVGERLSGHKADCWKADIDRKWDPNPWQKKDEGAGCL